MESSQSSETKRIPMILFLGPENSGKTSLINLLTDTKSNPTKTTTFSSERFPIGDSEVLLVDTPPLTNKSAPDFENFIYSKNNLISACVFVVRFDEVDDSKSKSAYNIARQAASQFNVPLIMAVTYLDVEANMNLRPAEIAKDMNWKFEAKVGVTCVSDLELSHKTSVYKAVVLENKYEARKNFLETLKSKALLGDNAKLVLGFDYFVISSFESDMFKGETVKELEIKPKKKCVIL